MSAGNPEAQGVRRASVAHCFAGMTVQGVLFFAIDAAMGVLRERNQGIWRRLRASPLSRMTLLAARAISGSIISLLIITAVLLFGALVFGVRIRGTSVGFVMICFATAIMASTLGLLIATLGRTEQQSRGFAIFAILVMVMLSGAWMPSFMMPKLMQKFAVILPSRWAVEGLDGTTWRGWGLADAIGPTAAILGFAILFMVISWRRFRWEGD